MTWYSAGTVSVTNGGTNVIGTGTDFVTYVNAGQGFVGPDGLHYEIASVVSATLLTLARAYRGSTASGQSYSISPIQGYLRDLALQSADLLLSFSSVRDNAGAGMFGDGSVATPGVRFVNDQDTGFYRPGTNTIAWVTNGTERVRVDASGNVGIGIGAPVTQLHVANQIHAGTGVSFSNDASRFSALGSTIPNYGLHMVSNIVTMAGYSGLALFTGQTERMRIDSSGNVGIGVTPSRLLHIGGRSSPEFLIQSSDAASWKARITFGNAAVKWEMGSDIGNVGNNNFYWYDAVAGAERMRISSSGNLGIGVSGDAAEALHLARPGWCLQRMQNSAGIANLGVVNGTGDFAIDASTSGKNIYFQTAGVERARITAVDLSVSVNVVPLTDNSRDLGWSGGRFRTIYAATGSINTSDERAKQDITPIPDEWLDAWAAVDWKRYKFIDAVQAKGDIARWHLGLVAQAVRDAFAEKGLDAERIGLLCFDQWDEQTEPVYETVEIPEVLDDDGNVIEPARTEQQDTGETRVTQEAGDRWGLRYDECQAMEAAWQRREIARQAGKIATLEALVANLTQN